MIMSKDSQVASLQLDVRSLAIKADLVAGESEAPALVSIDNSTIAATVIEIDVKEDVKACQKLQVIDRASGEAAPISAAPSISGSVISVTLDATGLADVCIEVLYK
jgi:hypothetical protein